MTSGIAAKKIPRSWRQNFQPASVDLSGSKLIIIHFHPPPPQSPHQISIYLKKSCPTRIFRFSGPLNTTDSPLWATNLGPAYESTISSSNALGSAFVGLLEQLVLAILWGPIRLSPQVSWIFFG